MSLPAMRRTTVWSSTRTQEVVVGDAAAQRLDRRGPARPQTRDHSLGIHRRILLRRFFAGSTPPGGAPGLGDQPAVSSPAIPRARWYLQKNSTNPDAGIFTVTLAFASGFTSWSIFWSVSEKLCRAVS